MHARKQTDQTTDALYRFPALKKCHYWRDPPPFSRFTRDSEIGPRTSREGFRARHSWRVIRRHSCGTATDPKPRFLVEDGPVSPATSRPISHARRPFDTRSLGPAAGHRPPSPRARSSRHFTAERVTTFYSPHVDVGDVHTFITRASSNSGVSVLFEVWPAERRRELAETLSNIAAV